MWISIIELNNVRTVLQWEIHYQVLKVYTNAHIYVINSVIFKMAFEILYFCYKA